MLQIHLGLHVQLWTRHTMVGLLGDLRVSPGGSQVDGLPPAPDDQGPVFLDVREFYVYDWRGAWYTPRYGIYLATCKGACLSMHLVRSY